MARRIRAKLILELREQRMSRRSISKTRHMPMESVCEVFDLADERGITWAEVRDMSDEEVYRLFYPFVGVLPFSQKAYFEPMLDMKERTWLRCHVHMFEFWGGVPERTVCDNLRCAVAHLRLSGTIIGALPP